LPASRVTRAGVTSAGVFADADADADSDSDDSDSDAADSGSR
jgi:hypothetical protein